MGSSTHKLRICLLGTFRMESGDREVPTDVWKSKKALALFKYLVAKNGEKAPRDVLIDLLWPEADADESASHNLHTTVYFMRKALKPYVTDVQSCVRCSNSLYWFEPGEEIWVDTGEFVAHYHQSSEMLVDNPLGALEHFARALELYRGDFLAEDLYEDWLVGMREHYRELYIDMVLKGASLLAKHRSDYTMAVRLCKEALNHDPYREELYQAIIEYLIRAGRYSEAAVHYRQCAKMLRDEFGLSVSPETKAIYNEMRRLSNLSDTSDAAVSDTNDAGPYVCDRNAFDSIYELAQRQQSRDELPFTRMEIVSTSGTFTKSIIQAVFAILAGLLRRGDVVCQYEPNKIVILLLKTGEEGARVVARRLERAFQTGPVQNLTLAWQVVAPRQVAGSVGARR